MFRRHLFRLAATGLVLASLGLAVSAPAQEPEILDWNWSVEPVTGGAAGSYRIVFRAKIAAGYIIYGSDFEADLGPKPTRVRYAPGAAEPAGALQSFGTRRRTDPTFRTEYSYFDGVAELAQTVQVPAGATSVGGTIAGQTCHEADGTCALFSQRFDIPLR